MVKGRRPPNSKRRKETAYSFFGLYLSNRYAALLRGARDELVEDNLFPIYFPPLVESKYSNLPCSYVSLPQPEQGPEQLRAVLRAGQ
jgi:hypothetical protein